MTNTVATTMFHRMMRTFTRNQNDQEEETRKNRNRRSEREIKKDTKKIREKSLERLRWEARRTYYYVSFIWHKENKHKPPFGKKLLGIIEKCNNGKVAKIPIMFEHIEKFTRKHEENFDCEKIREYDKKTKCHYWKEGYYETLETENIEEHSHYKIENKLKLWAEITLPKGYCNY